MAKITVNIGDFCKLSTTFNSQPKLAVFAPLIKMVSEAMKGLLTSVLGTRMVNSFNQGCIR